MKHVVEMSKTFRAITLMMLALTVILSTGCPDAQSEFETFLTNTEDMRGGAQDLVVETAGDVDFSGVYFLAVSTDISPGVPLLFGTTVEVAEDGETVNMTFQPLVADRLFGVPKPNAREPVGDAIVVNDIPLDDGTFVADMGEVTVDGEANPITGTNILAIIILHGNVLSEDLFCGTVGGRVLEPVDQELLASTFSSVRSEDFSTIETPVFECPESVVPTGDDAPDAGQDLAPEVEQEVVEDAPAEVVEDTTPTPDVDDDTTDDVTSVDQSD